MLRRPRTVFDGKVETAAAVWPILLDTNYSGDATAILIGLEDSAFTMAGPRFQATGYCSATNSGSWSANGAEVRKWLRWEFCREWWLDKQRCSGSCAMWCLAAWDRNRDVLFPITRMKWRVSKNAMRNRLILACFLASWCVFSLATDAYPVPWLVVSSNRLDSIRQDFYALPRPALPRMARCDPTWTCPVPWFQV